MRNPGEHIKKSLKKSEEAMHRFQARREEFLITREQIVSDIEEARSIWLKTLEQLPVLEFNTQKQTSRSPREVRKRKLNNQ